jgi:hypothetical protein
MSFSSKVMSEIELNGFLATIRRKNLVQNITGLLLYSDEVFIQIIEGEKDMIHHLFKLISQDPRHFNMVKLIEEPISKRAFPSWSMGFRKLDKSNKASIVRYSDFMQNDKLKFDLVECQGKRI